jgi:hypothetical protein
MAAGNSAVTRATQEDIMQTWLVVAAVLVGAALSMRFKVLILLPAIGGMWIIVGLSGIGRGESLGAVVLTAIVCAVALQLSYLAGLGGRHYVWNQRGLLFQVWGQRAGLKEQ